MTTVAWIDDLVARLGFWRSERRPWRPPTEDETLRLEAELGGALDPVYRHFVFVYGGGLLGTDDFNVEAPIREPCPWGDSVDPEQFYPLLDEHPNDLGKQLRTYRDRIPRGVLPIADDAGGNQVCLDVAGSFPGSVWFWDHEQRWFTGNLEETARELDAAGMDTRRFHVHRIIREWARLHPERFDRPPDYMGMYRIADSFEDFLRSLVQVPYE